jgi:hypothetical protein
MIVSRGGLAVLAAFNILALLPDRELVVRLDFRNPRALYI